MLSIVSEAVETREAVDLFTSDTSLYHIPQPPIQTPLFRHPDVCRAYIACLQDLSRAIFAPQYSSAIFNLNHSRLQKIIILAVLTASSAADKILCEGGNQITYHQAEDDLAVLAFNDAPNPNSEIGSGSSNALRSDAGGAWLTYCGKRYGNTFLLSTTGDCWEFWFRHLE
jgi:hypothetical protein